MQTLIYIFASIGAIVTLATLIVAACLWSARRNAPWIKDREFIDPETIARTTRLRLKR